MKLLPIDIRKDINWLERCKKGEILIKKEPGFISTHTKTGSLYYTDDWHAYASLSVKGNHVAVSKGKSIPKGRSRINIIEGFWSYAKHGLYPYRGVPKDNFPLYLKEIEWRFNNRNVNLAPLLRKMLKHPILKSS